MTSLFLLFSCQIPSSLTDTEISCFSTPPSEGSVRLHPLSRSAEFQSDHNRRGDWILENAQERFIIRHESSSMSHVDAPGGTLIDVGKNDLIFEIRPIDVPYNLFARTQIEDDHAILSFHHDNLHVLSYTLYADTHVLELSSDYDFLIYPNPSTVHKHQQCYYCFYH